MGLFNKKKNATDSAVVSDKHSSSAEGTPSQTPYPQGSLNEQDPDNLPATPLAITLGCIASIGGFMFGYESGQISGLFFTSTWSPR